MSDFALVTNAFVPNVFTKSFLPLNRTREIAKRKKKNIKRAKRE